MSALGGSWTTRTARFAVDDVVLAWSDGLVEAPEDGAEVPDAELAAVVGGLDPRDPRPLVEGILAALRQNAADWRRDDVTLVAVRRTS
jgi:serine phosphatase RsbU (regulator of sigma subunit)